MIEVALQLKLESFLINSMGMTSEVSSQMSARALRLSCEKVLGARAITDSKPSADFEFLGASGKPGAKIESDQAFDEQVSAYLAAHPAFDTSKIVIASGTSGYSTSPKSAVSGEIGRLFIAESASQRSLMLELLFKPEEFDAVWELTAKQKIQRVFATLICFKLSKADSATLTDKKMVAGVLSCALQLPPNT